MGSFSMINGANLQHQGKSENRPLRLLRNAPVYDFRCRGTSRTRGTRAKPWPLFTTLVAQKTALPRLVKSRFNGRMTFSNDFINARIADVMLETNLRPKPDYIRNPKDGQRFLDATQNLLTKDQLEPETGSMEDGLLGSMGPVLYRVTMLGLIR